MRIAEPTTTLTDGILGFECLLLGGLLWRRCRGVQAARWLALALTVTGVGALLGGVSHGFRPSLEGTVWQPLLWTATLWSIGLTAFFFLGAMAHATLGGGGRRVVMGLASVQLLVYLGWTAGHDEFLWAIVDYVPAMTVALGLALLLARRGAAAAGPLIFGIVLTFVGAGIQASGLALHRHFNHNDLFHVVQMVAVWFLYRGGALLAEE